MFDKIDIKDRKEKFQSLEKEAKQVTVNTSAFWLTWCLEMPEIRFRGPKFY